LTIATVLTAAPGRPQTYDPANPVCLQAYGMEGSTIECDAADFSRVKITKARLQDRPSPD
jgi:hypothetical protein